MSHNFYLFTMNAFIVFFAFKGIFTIFEVMAAFLLLQIVDELNKLVAYKKKEDATLERLMKNAK